MKYNRMVRALPWMSVNGTAVMNSEFLRSLDMTRSDPLRQIGAVGIVVLRSWLIRGSTGCYLDKRSSRCYKVIGGF